MIEERREAGAKHEAKRGAARGATDGALPSPAPSSSMAGLPDRASANGASWPSVVATVACDGSETSTIQVAGVAAGSPSDSRVARTRATALAAM